MSKSQPTQDHSAESYIEHARLLWLAGDSAALTAQHLRAVRRAMGGGELNVPSLHHTLVQLYSRNDTMMDIALALIGSEGRGAHLDRRVVPG